MATRVTKVAFNSFALFQKAARGFQVASLAREIATLCKCTSLAILVADAPKNFARLDVVLLCRFPIAAFRGTLCDLIERPSNVLEIAALDCSVGLCGVSLYGVSLCGVSLCGAGTEDLQRVVEGAFCGFMLTRFKSRRTNVKPSPGDLAFVVYFAGKIEALRAS
jgi:hypothetical protein